MLVTELAESRGWIDVARIEDGRLRLEGWAASVESGPLTSFELAWDGRAYPYIEITSGIPSPDVAQVHPKLDHVQRCRFQVFAPLDVDRIPSPSTLIELTPVFGDRHGCMMFEVMQPVLPYPSQEAMNSVGSGFKAGSQEFLAHFIQRAGLRPSEQVLDVGCGIGRMAYSLVYYLEPQARYCGFDVVDSMIAWCRETITPRFPNFHFRKVDLFNPWYNPGGKEKALDFRFPYEDERFDFVFLTSVFTHLRGAEVRHYLDEIHRVLKPGGRCLCTMFLLNRESRDLIERKQSSQNLVYRREDFFTANPEVPEDAIGFKESLMLHWILERNFRIGAKYYGHWCGRLRSTSYQDMLVLYK